MSVFRHYTLAKQTFHGARFEDHGLDLDVLPEILAFKSLIAEVAKDLWRRKNPERERLTMNFEDRFRVKIFSIQGGSATVPLERIYSVADDALIVEPPDDEFDEAVDLIADSITAVQNERRLPSGLSRRVIPMFVQFTACLLPDEAISFISGRSSKNATFTRDTKFLFERRITADFQDEITVRGELRAGDFIQEIRNDPNVEVELQTTSLFQRALSEYVRHTDKKWSLIDCASISVMRSRGLIEALTNDHHFEQAGFTILLKQE
jgi:predicted nucleic acid-binding protein